MQKEAQDAPAAVVQGLQPADPAHAPGEAYVLEVNEFLKVFCCAFLSVGAQTARVARNCERIAIAYGLAVDMAVFPRHIMLTVSAPGGKYWSTSVGSIRAGAPDFQKVAEINSLGWRIVDERMALPEANEALSAIMAEPRYNPALVRLMISFANAAFCHLFGGDAIAMGLVFCATLVGFFLRQIMQSWRIDGKVVFFVCALIASLLAAPGVLLGWGATPHTGLAASVLFLIPGIPLINAVLDILDGHVLIGFSRSVHAFILIACIALGLAMTMALLGVSSL